MIQYFNSTIIVKAALLLGTIVFADAFTNNKLQAQAPYPLNGPVSYVRTWDAVAPEQDGAALVTRPVKDVKQATQYFDGLGRPIQTVMKQASMETGGTPTDMVSPVLYDDLGREEKKYLPFVANFIGGNPSITDGSFQRAPFTQQQIFMTNQYQSQGETYFYSKTDFETSPLNRVVKTMAPGNSWVGNGIGVSMKYWNNTSTDNVKIWNVSNSGSFGLFGTYEYVPSRSGPLAYSAGKLYKSITVDEHGKQVIEFKDKDGRVVLKKIQLTGPADDGSGIAPSDAWLCTYYIYDKLNNLRCVVQPEGVKGLIANNWEFSSTLLSEQCFRYEYDERNRMIMKKVPGADPVYMVYDRWDRMILTQDGNQRITNTWIFTKYDEQNRPILTGLHSDATNTTLAAMIAHVNASTGWATRYESINTSLTYGYTTTQTYPSVSSPTILTATHYDDYTGLPGGLPGSYLTTWNSYFSATDNNIWPYPQMPQQSMATKGMATWSQVRVLGTGTMLTTVMIYDDKERVIQMQSTNITGGIDVGTTQYTWAGQPLVMVQKQQKSTGTAEEHIVVTKMQYDEMGRVMNVRKAVNSTIGSTTITKAEQYIAQNEYDKLGQVKKKTLGNNSLETLNYEYNIHGWMLGMNRDYAKDMNNTNYFGFDLGYDKNNNGIIGGSAYTNPQLNGNIEGMVWKSKGDGEKRKYDFYYDAANRLLRGDFTQYTGGTFNQTAGINYSMKMGDGTDVTTAYDDNGNIKAMTQYGWKLGGNVNTPIDNLTYNYIPGSNKLLNVIDANNDPLTKLGDFRTSSLHPDPTKTPTTVDYTYDANGNLKKDLNKDIGTAAEDGIIYNHLNLPQSITVRKTGGLVKGTINYTYDAAGNKLKKDVAETGQPLKTTLYLGGAVYENDALQFVGHEEGRLRYSSSGGGAFHFDYMLKDHLGNVRMVLTEETKTDIYPAATLEEETYNGGTAISVEDDYYTINANVVDAGDVGGLPTYYNNNSPVPNNNPYSNVSAENLRLYRLNANGGTANNKTGLGVVLKVMAGDVVNIYGKSYHKKPSGGYTNSINAIVLSELINAFAGSGIVSGHGATGTQITGQPGFPSTIDGLTGNPPAQSTDRPRAAINWIIFDEQFKYVSGGFDMVGTDGSGSGVLKSHDLGNIPVPKNGYIYVYCSNESRYPVFFDNLQLVHTRGPILEETHYYPFGLTMGGISSKATLLGKENKFKFNGGTELSSNEFSDGIGLELYETPFRSYDAQIARFLQSDPLSEATDNWTLYAFCNNNPLLFNDVFGLDTTINGVHLTTSEYNCSVTIPVIKTKPASNITIPPTVGFIGVPNFNNPYQIPKLPPEIVIPEAPIEPPAKLPLNKPIISSGTVLKGAGVIVLLLTPLDAGPANETDGIRLLERRFGTKPYTGHGNSDENWNPHDVYMFRFKPKPGDIRTPVLKYGIYDVIKNPNRAKNQMGLFQSLYGQSVTLTVLTRTSGRLEAKRIEKSSVTIHNILWKEMPREQIRPGSFLED